MASINFWQSQRKAWFTRKRIEYAFATGWSLFLTSFFLAGSAYWTSGTAEKQTLPASNPPSLTIVPGREFAADSYVHKPLAPNAPIDPKSAVWVANIQRQIKTHYGVASVNIHEYSPSIFIVSAAQPTVKVKNVLSPGSFNPMPEPPVYPPLQAQWDAVPLPDNFQPSLGTDKEAVVYQLSTGKYWEFWQTEKTGSKILDSSGRKVDEWQAAWGGKIDDLTKSPGHFESSEGKFGTQATGISFLSTIMTIDEQRRGIINHPLQLVVVEALRGSYAWPAQRSDGQIVKPNAIPEGARFRLPANLDLDALEMDPYARMIAKAVQTYGLIVTDTGGAVVFRAENPSNQYAIDPYYGKGGILKCPGNFDSDTAPEICWPNSRLKNFPWDRLQALKVSLRRH